MGGVVMNQIHLPRWEKLPDIDLYMDQVLSLTDRYLNPMGLRPLTAAMINNYVKLQLIPKPVGKRYTRMHVAYIFAIAVLKDVFEIAQIKSGVQTQIRLLGLKNAYNLFTQEIENAINLLSKQCPIEDNTIIMKLAALAFASKRLTANIINMREQEKVNEQDE